jgi:hypothetical protein
MLSCNWSKIVRTTRESELPGSGTPTDHCTFTCCNSTIMRYVIPSKLTYYDYHIEY